MTATVDAEQVSWSCDQCHRPIEDGDGYITIGIKLESRWHVYHARCDPHPNVYAYSFEVERARSADEVGDWELHLGGKMWFHDGDWETFLRRCSRGTA